MGNTSFTVNDGDRFRRGTGYACYKKLGAHIRREGGKMGVRFCLWAPNAQRVSLVGSFNGWDWDATPMEKIEGGVWVCFAEGIGNGALYKYCVTGADGRQIYKSDPFAAYSQTGSETASIVWNGGDFRWGDGEYMQRRAKRDFMTQPMSIYELHLGSWKNMPGERPLYRELADALADYCTGMGYTHIELLPIMEYPYDPSWGYQITCYFAPTYRYGTPKQLMRFVDACHKAGIGVILDWVPAHFPKDENGLFEFDGTCCYELSDPMMNEHPDWTTRIYDYGKPEVQSFLISNACYWLRYFHVDGIRVDAVASMLYLDYNRRQFKPNKFGGRENLEAIEFLRRLNEAAFQANPAVMMIAEESTAFPLITKPDYDGGLGFLFKWNMGWMNDMLKYMSLDPLWRKGDHNALTFSMTYAYSENFIRPLSHDEVVHGKCSLINKMPGNYDDKFNNLRTFFAYQMAHPGKKLNFMGNEFAQFIEWNYTQGLDWLLLGYEKHQKMQHFVRTLNHFYLENRCLWENDSDWDGFRWLSCDDRDNSVVAFRRISRKGQELLAVCNFCPVLRENYRLPLPKAGWYQAVLNTDDAQFGGFDFQPAPVHAEKEKQPQGEYAYSGVFRIPPMSVCFYKHVRNKPEK